MRHEPAAGLAAVRVYTDGAWRTVVVDDRLPAHRATRRPLYAVGVDSDRGPPDDPRAQGVMWPALLEKAYAKAHGCYENLRGGALPHALRDLSAAAPQRLRLADPHVAAQVAAGTLWRQLLDWARAGTLVVAEYRRPAAGDGDRGGWDWLRSGCGYAVTDAREVREGAATLCMVRLRNPAAAEFPAGGEWARDGAAWRRHKVGARCVGRARGRGAGGLVASRGAGRGAARSAWRGCGRRAGAGVSGWERSGRAPAESAGTLDGVGALWDPSGYAHRPREACSGRGPFGPVAAPPSPRVVVRLSRAGRSPGPFRDTPRPSRRVVRPARLVRGCGSPVRLARVARLVLEPVRRDAWWAGEALAGAP